MQDVIIPFCIRGINLHSLLQHNQTCTPTLQTQVHTISKIPKSIRCKLHWSKNDAPTCQSVFFGSCLNSRVLTTSGDFVWVYSTVLSLCSRRENPSSRMLWNVWHTGYGTSSAVSAGSVCPLKRWCSSSRENVTSNTTCALPLRRMWPSWWRWSISKISFPKGAWASFEY